MLEGTHVLDSSEIVQNLTSPGASYLAYFFFDFKDVAKQDNRALLSSLVIQLSTQSKLCFGKLSEMYSEHGGGSRQPSEDTLLKCLKDMLTTSTHAPIYLVVDAVDECPNISKAIGAPLARQEVLDVIKEVVELRLPNLHVCITSRPEVDIQDSIKQLACIKVSLHEQDGQKNDIAAYVRYEVYSNKHRAMKTWSGELKEQIIETLSSKADGMYECRNKFITLPNIAI
jgi:hypothetical protein